MEAIEKGKVALEASLKALEEEGKPIPKPGRATALSGEDSRGDLLEASLRSFEATRNRIKLLETKATTRGR
jgi:exonuclease VII small subunit